MKRVLKIGAYLLGALILIVAAVLLFFHFKGMPNYEIEDSGFTVTYDSAHVARGEYIVGTSCIHCHQDEDRTLAGRLAEKGDFGTVYSSNITNHPTAGIGRYTDGELAYMLRTGIKKNGKQAFPMMPALVHLSDEDLASVIAFLRSDHRWTAPVDKAHPDPRPSLLAKALMTVAFDPQPYPEKAVQAPPRTDRVAYGKYLLDGIFECYSCHSASFTTNNLAQPELSKGYLGGGTLVANQLDHSQQAYSANLTMHPEYGLGAWSKEEFAQAVRFGQGKDGTGLSPAMPKYPTITDADIDALWAYLQTVPVLDNEVPTVVE